MLGKINKEFWLGQVFTLFATVLGVYLAANSGFEKALEFENFKQERDVFFLKQSLVLEMESNVNELDEWMNEYNKNPSSNDMTHNPDSYQFDQLLWGTIEEGGVAAEIPYTEIKQMSDFYIDGQNLLKQMKSGNPFGAPEVKKAYKILSDRTKNEALPSLKKSLSKDKKFLIDNGIILEN